MIDWDAEFSKIFDMASKRLGACGFQPGWQHNHVRLRYGDSEIEAAERGIRKAIEYGRWISEEASNALSEGCESHRERYLVATGMMAVLSAIREEIMKECIDDRGKKE